MRFVLTATIARTLIDDRLGFDRRAVVFESATCEGHPYTVPHAGQSNGGLECGRRENFRDKY